VHILAATLIALALPETAPAEVIDSAAIEARIADLESSYGRLLSDISCDAPTIPAHQIMCASGLDPASNPILWRMGRLDDLAWVYAVENATKEQVDLANPPRDENFIARRDACEDETCLARLLIEHTNDSLGGTSPYPQ
jgi:hypothetical protein